MKKFAIQQYQISIHRLHPMRLLHLWTCSRFSGRLQAERGRWMDTCTHTHFHPSLWQWWASRSAPRTTRSSRSYWMHQCWCAQVSQRSDEGSTWPTLSWQYPGPWCKPHHPFAYSLYWKMIAKIKWKDLILQKTPMTRMLELFGNLIFRKPEIQVIEKPDDPTQKDSLAKKQWPAHPHPHHAGERTFSCLQQLYEIENIRTGIHMHPHILLSPWHAPLPCFSK